MKARFTHTACNSTPKPSPHSYAFPIRILLLMATGFALAAELDAAGTSASAQRREAKAAAKAFWDKYEPLKKNHSGLVRLAKMISEGRAGFTASYGFLPRQKPNAAQLCATCPKMRAQATWANALVSGLEKWNKDCDKDLEELAQNKKSLPPAEVTTNTALLQELKKALNS